MVCNEARELNHNYVGTEHLLLAVLRSDSSAAEYLQNAGIDIQRLRDRTIEVLGVRDE
jgi:ATP-dependent Clp protease ATP-binding subunit ClpC